MLILPGLGLLPSGGRQFGDPVDGPTAELGQYLGQVFPQVDVQAPAGFYDRRDGRHFRPGFRTAKVHLVLAAKRQWAPRHLRTSCCRSPPARSANRAVFWFAVFEWLGRATSPRPSPQLGMAAWVGRPAGGWF